MLSSVSSSLAQLTQLPVAPDDAPGASAARQAAPRAAVARAGARAAVATSSSSSAAKTAKAAKAPAKSKASGAGYASATSSASSSSKAKSTAGAKKSGPLAFLDDPKLSMEEKLLKLLGYLNDKWNKDLDKKMKEFKKEGTASSSGSSTPRSSSSSGGLAGLARSAVGFVAGTLPGLGVGLDAIKTPVVRTVLKNVAGPALAAAATAAGLPQLAPVALKYGPELVDAAASIPSRSGSGSGSAPRAGAGGSTSSSSATKETADGLGSDKDAQLKLMEMQRILDQQKEMFSLVSNMLRTTHDTRMAVIQNVR